MSIVLATDLDGTFLGGDAGQRSALYQWLAGRRDSVTLIYVTGRGLGFIRDLARELPPAARPDHAVANVGTTAASGDGLTPLEPVEAWLEARWPADAPARIDSLLRAHDHLTPQPVVEGRRASYYFSDAEQALVAQQEVEAAGFDALLSDDLYFDVLPRGVRKGPTLLRVLEALSLPREDVLVAGDTLNDLSLFETGLAGVAVANSEPALVDAVQAMPHVQRSTQPGAAGVLEALTQFETRRKP
ncbi:MAG: HAD family hydrolase [Deferrisomatales bacterium]